MRLRFSVNRVPDRLLSILHEFFHRVLLLLLLVLVGLSLVLEISWGAPGLVGVRVAEGLLRLGDALRGLINSIVVAAWCGLV